MYPEIIFYSLIFCKYSNINVNFVIGDDWKCVSQYHFAAARHLIGYCRIKDPFYASHKLRMFTSYVSIKRYWFSRTSDESYSHFKIADSFLFFVFFFKKKKALDEKLHFVLIFLLPNFNCNVCFSKVNFFLTQVHNARILARAW